MPVKVGAITYRGNLEMNSPEWIKFRDTCVCCLKSQTIHADKVLPSADQCCEIDDKKKVCGIFGDCCEENCAASWRKALNNKFTQELLNARERNESI